MALEELERFLAERLGRLGVLGGKLRDEGIGEERDVFLPLP